jgi:ABC-2 type transport system ATP-binding protein
VTNASPGTLAVEATGIVRRYGEHRGLDQFDLAVPQGCIFGLLGPNGSGKSTFLALLAAADFPDEGNLVIFGEQPSFAMRKRIGIVFQEPTLDPLTRVGESLELSGRLFGLPRKDSAERGREMLARFGLADRYREPVSRLSGGMRRRVEVARALLHQPALLLLDEPTTGIDPEERQVIWEAIREWAGKEHTALLATNDLAEADGICDYAAFLREGRVVTTGTPMELKAGLRREAVWLEWPAATDQALETIASWDDVGSVVRDDGAVQFTVDDASTVVPRLFQSGFTGIEGVRIHLATLEDAYFHHVGKRIREADEVPA